MKGYLEVNLHPYQVDGEVARFTFNTHSLIQDKKVNYSTSIELFSSLHGNEWYKTGGFKEIAIFNGIIDLSYRKTTIKINRIRHQENATPTRTFKDNVELEGDKIIDFLKHKTAKIFKEKGFNDEGIPQYQPEEYRKLTLVALEKEKIEKAIQSCGASTEEIEIIRENQMCYEEPKQTVNISIDGVLSKKQKEKRDGEKKEKQNGKKKREYIHNTVIHVQQGKLTYVLNALGIANALRLLIAFLITNEKLNQRLQFFVDGQRSLQNTIFLCFAWYKNICLILDWYHLIEKCKMQLSMAFNEILNELTHLLWYGLVDEAIKVVKSIGKRSVKNQKELEKLIGYFKRNKEYIPVYAVRKGLGLRNSSNIGERMNGLIVSERQKHNGMSWSKAGSAALATVTVLKRNQEEQKWLNENDISFKWAA